MSEWMFRKLTDYWDQQSGAQFEEGAIHRHSRRIAALPDTERATASAEISECIVKHSEALDDEQLVLAALSLSDDLYKAVTQLTYLDDFVLEYLGAVCAPFWAHLTRSGYAVQYVVNNEYENTPYGMAGPLNVFPDWFGAAGVAYVCPQAMSLLLMRHDSVPEEDQYLRMRDYIREGRHVARNVLVRARLESRHFVYLDTDMTDDSMASATAGFEELGVIGIVRTEAPGPGSRCTLYKPEGPYPR